METKRPRQSSSSNRNEDSSEDIESEIKLKKIKNATDLQRLKLEKLQKKHAENKKVFIPEPPKERKLREPLEFIRNIWGSSAGVGSGDFDVYRGIRRRELARQKFVLGKAEKEDLDEAYKQKVAQNQIDADERTAKKREKRQKKKQKMKDNKKKKPNTTEKVEEEESESEEDPPTHDQPEDKQQSNDERIDAKCDEEKDNSDGETEEGCTSKNVTQEVTLTESVEKQNDSDKYIVDIVEERKHSSDEQDTSSDSDNG